MSRVKAVLGIVAIGAALGVAAGCGGSSAGDAQTPSNAATVVNSAAQTDSTGKTVPAPGATTSAPAGGGGGAAATGDVAAGKAKFDSTCGGCHTNGGQQAGVGPKLAGLGLAKARIETQIKNGGGPMPANLVTGTDLDNVVAYVLSIQ